jgi:hypothetical protein
MRSCALLTAHAAGARVHLPLPDVPEGVRPAVHGGRGRQAPRPTLDAQAPVDLHALERRRAKVLQCLRHPLTYHRVESGTIGVTIGSLDDPEAARPVERFSIESELSWTRGPSALPAKRTEDWMREYGIAHIDSSQYSAQRRRSDEA